MFRSRIIKKSISRHNGSKKSIKPQASGRNAGVGTKNQIRTKRSSNLAAGYLHSYGGGGKK